LFFDCRLYQFLTRCTFLLTKLSEISQKCPASLKILWLILKYWLYWVHIVFLTNISSTSVLFWLRPIQSWVPSWFSSTWVGKVQPTPHLLQILQRLLLLLCSDPVLKNITYVYIFRENIIKSENYSCFCNSFFKFSYVFLNCHRTIWFFCLSSPRFFLVLPSRSYVCFSNSFFNFSSFFFNFHHTTWCICLFIPTFKKKVLSRNYARFCNSLFTFSSVFFQLPSHHLIVLFIYTNSFYRAFFLFLKILFNLKTEFWQGLGGSMS
jgi:hypothetical protein